jgi:hypothetical protein
MEFCFGYSLQNDDPALEGIRALRNIVSRYETVKKLPIFTKVYRFLLYCVGTSLFEKMGVHFDTQRFFKIEESIIKKEFHMGPDFIHCMLDTILYVTEVGYQCMVTGSIDPFFHHESTYDRWIQEGEKLREQSQYISNPEPHGFTVFDFLNRLDDNIEKGQSIAKFIGKSDPASALIRRLLSELTHIRASCLTKRLAQQERKAPFSVLIHGGSSVGKSSFTKLLFYHYGKMMNLPITDEYKYTRNAFDKYWTNFNSSQWCVQLDDIAYLHPNKASDCDPSLVEMLQVVNNVPYVPTQADLADKGRTPVRARFVIATTNTENLNAEVYFSCPLAVQRRLPFVVSIEPLPQYRKDGGPMLDPSKLPVVKEGSYPDYWKITVKKIVPASSEGIVKHHIGQTAVAIKIHEFESVIDFLAWFSVEARKADQVQDKAMDCDATMSNVELCKHDVPVRDCTLCSTPGIRVEARQVAPPLPTDEVTLQDDDIIDLLSPEGPTGPQPGALTVWQQRVYANQLARDDIGDRVDQSEMWFIIREISKMAFPARWVATWYFWIVGTATEDSWKGFFAGLLASCFYGNWWWFIIWSKIVYWPETRRIAMHVLGRRVYRRIRTKEAVLFSASIVMAVTLLKTYRAVKAFFPEPTIQSDVAEVGVAPEPNRDKHENVWYKDSFEVTPFDVPASSASRRSWTQDDLVKHVSRNCVAFKARVRVDDNVMREKRGKAVCIGGNFYMANNHCLPWDGCELEIISQNSKDGVTSNTTCLITPDQLTRYPDLDLVFIQIHALPPKRDIREMFAKQSFEGRFDGEYVMRGLDGALTRNRLKAPAYQRDFKFEENEVSIKSPVWRSKSERLTENGDCGALFCATSTMGPVLLGIHVLGSTNSSCYAISVSQEFLLNLPFRIYGATSPTLQVGDYKQVLVDLNKKATVRYINSGTATVFGSFAGFRGKMKSRVRPTLMHGQAKRDGYVANTGPPVMNSWVPWRLALLDLVNPVTHIDQTTLNHCADMYLNEILMGLTEEDIKEIQVYNVTTAVNGCPGLAYVDKMPRNTSAGFPFRKSKKFFLTAMEPFGEYTNPVEVTPEIVGEMQSIINKYEKCELYHPIFTASLKDEPVSFKKMKEGKTRVFCGAPLPWSLVGRMYFLSLIRVIQQNRILFEAGPGTVAQSVEWGFIYDHIAEFGTDRIVAGDYKSFDKSMPPGVILAAFGVLRGLMVKAEWPEEHIRVAEGIAYDTAYPMVDYHGDLIQFHGSNPSGHILTVIINCLANSIYCRYCFAKASDDGSCATFRQNVHLYTYGDDLIMGVNRECTWFSHTVMQRELQLVGIGFTMADKEAESVPFVHMRDATFLRRAWRFDPDVGNYVCPLEHNSINKMLTMCVESKTVGPELHALAVMETALREYFCYGRKEFETRREMFLSWVDELDLHAYVEREFPTWDSLLDDFARNSLHRTQVRGLPAEEAQELVCTEPHQNLSVDGISPSRSGFADPCSVQLAFKEQNDAHSGVCQSCAPVLEQERCVVNPEPQHFFLQSGDGEIGALSAPGDSIAATTVEFLDETPGTSWSIESQGTSHLADMQPQVNLAQFLQRPVLIKSHIWSQTDTSPTAATWDPWHLFFNSAPIKNKINNYYLINCKLKLKFVINASPFYSGAMAFTYCPLQTLTGNSIVSDSAGGELMLHSQRPLVWIFPQTCEGGEMTLPFLYHKNWLDLTVAIDVQAMGTITPCLFAPLASANGLTGQSVTINVYAWAEDIKLHAPTTKLVLQADEFEYKPSQVASSVASAASMLSRIPLIGAYMKATSVVASSVASTAAAFGYTNVPNMDTVSYMKPVVFPHNSSCEVSVPMDRSAVDPKNEVTIDPRTVGLDGKDELSITNIVSRETWLGNAILSSTDAVDALTLVSRVTPALSFSAGANAPRQMTPMAYLGTQFKYWRGDIIFRFKFVCTRFHKGRVRITFDPVNNISTTVPDYTTVFNEVLDIGAEQDVEVRVPYSQATTYLLTSNDTGNYNLSGSPLSPNTLLGNGLITMRVVNPLSAPLAVSAIPVMVFVRAAENFEFAQPDNKFNTFSAASPFVLQSAELSYPIEPKRVIVGNKATQPDPNRHHVHFGEAVVSLRPLIHRLAHQFTARIATSSGTFVLGPYQSRRLKYPGYVPTSSPWSANRIVGSGTAPYVFVRMGIHQMVSLLFVGERGSITHSYCVESGRLGRPSNVQLKRHNGTLVSGSYVNSEAYNTASASGVARAYQRFITDEGAGTALTDAAIQSGIVMNFPYYSPFNFQLVSPTKALYGQAEDQSNTDNVQLSLTYEDPPEDVACRVNVWSAYGPDYNFFFFKNVPSLYLYVLPHSP